jgi:hypothetical protein
VKRTARKATNESRDEAIVIPRPYRGAVCKEERRKRLAYERNVLQEAPQGNNRRETRSKAHQQTTPTSSTPAEAGIIDERPISDALRQRRVERAERTDQTDQYKKDKRQRYWER